MGKSILICRFLASLSDPQFSVGSIISGAGHLLTKAVTSPCFTRFYVRTWQ